MAKPLKKYNFLTSDIPGASLARLPVYLRVVSQLQQEQIKMTSSSELATFVAIEPSQIRKDLTYLGKFGMNGKGYTVKTLKNNLQKVLGADASWNAVMIGGGKLGKSTLEFINQKKSSTFRVAAIFDSNPKLIGKKISTHKIQNLNDIERTIKRRNIKIGFIATTNNYAQEAADILIENNLYYIINFSGFSPKIPDKVLLKNLDPGLQIESMTYHLRQDRLQKN
jgi:redox-sensing transcriptional repressor